ncbi:hypothetical protein HPB48_026795 [Haemaphysalis longicornis]|uniref:Endonuclease/exonuclease/phosphatase domain-containing protein n=1 Tax=Haemaphysalis longicornis TaxID=44386 RepID=A0A9J6HAE3_HAELO|nr:hypothetical protein HPB48_026795 [Haemaphysalis longicornis]
MATNHTATTVKPRSDLTVWQWNCHSYDNRAVLQQHVAAVNKKSDVIMLQETVTKAPSLPGYKAHISPAEDGVCAPLSAKAHLRGT